MTKPYEQLLSLPGVIGYGYGKKEVNGKITDTQALVVFVQKKVKPQELKEDEFVPQTVDGIITDVIEIGEIIAQSSFLEENLNRIKRYQELSQKFNHFKSRLTFKKISFPLKKTARPFKITGLPFNEVQFLQKIRGSLKNFFNLREMLDNLSVSDRKAYARPAAPGLSIGHFEGAAGTFGAVVYDRRTNQPLILSNNHVLANTSLTNDPKVNINDPVLQPARIDENPAEIGRLYKYAALEPYPKKNIVDGALAEPLRTEDIKPEIIGLGKVRGTAEPAVGMKVRKSGRTTGTTTGTIRATDVTIQVNFGPGRNLMFEKQILATKMSNPGDSGSLVLDTKNKAVGLLFAGSDTTTIINPIQPVLDLLGVRF